MPIIHGQTTHKTYQIKQAETELGNRLLRLRSMDTRQKLSSSLH